jgi:phage terminase large subunit
MEIKKTTALVKIASSNKRINLIWGGQAAGKTFAICALLINFCLYQANARVFVIGNEKTKLTDRAIRDIKTIVSDYPGVKFTNNSLFKFPNGSEIKCIGLDDVERGKSVRCDICFFNEISEIKSFLAFDHFAGRCKVVYADFNPSETFFYDDIINNYGADNIREVRLTWKDNECISTQEKERINKYKELGEHARVGSFANYMYEVYYCGNFSALGGGVFGDITPISAEQYMGLDSLEIFGIDFGDNSDPNAVVGVKYNNGAMYIREYIYHSLLSDSTLASLLPLHLTPASYFVYETATAGHTRVLNIVQAGVRAKFIPVIKQQVVPSVMSMSQKPLYLCGANLVKEFAGYKIIDGELQGVDGDHLIDAARYVDIMKPYIR